MPKKAAELSPRQVGELRTPGMHAVGVVAGLHLYVKSPNVRSWILRMLVGGRRRDMGLGGFPTVTLAMAREKAREARLSVERGIDPVQARRDAKAALMASRAREKTFEECARDYVDAKGDEWKNAKHRAQWLSTLESYAFPKVGRLQVRDIALPHVLEVLTPIWKTKTETASRVRGRIETVLSWATVRGYRAGENPARWRGHLDQQLARPTKIAKVKHHDAVDVDAVAAFTLALRQQAGVGARALEFVIFTATRSGEVRGATWDEFDLQGKLWTIPANRMKAGKEHRVPLSDTAVKIIESMPEIKGVPFVFAAVRGRMLSDMTLSAVMRRMEVGAVPHGFRSTFRDWAAERTSYPNEVVEMALAHAIADKTEAAYRRGDLFDKRRQLMDDWAKFVNTPIKAGGKVLPLTRKTAA